MSFVTPRVTISRSQTSVPPRLDQAWEPLEPLVPKPSLVNQGENQYVAMTNSAKTWPKGTLDALQDAVCAKGKHKSEVQQEKSKVGYHDQGVKRSLRDWCASLIRVCGAMEINSGLSGTLHPAGVGLMKLITSHQQEIASKLPSTSFLT